ncbi:extracellular solute-binding protein [Kineosporia sp. J2-2]|uniref:Extracellular solute-binding protein n=1 Tax=Kineosporia corallincola TaxID=2835133 RepID=A0ABS5TPU0_9ACTN|nr:extracellular solute-binding protein [Kineosporia corallincola]MBT0773106.1 extracellular solute-binding protein [Kineosporia corallincola]
MNSNNLTRRGFFGAGALAGLIGLSACGSPGGSSSGGSSGGSTKITMFHWAGAQATVPVKVGDAFAAANDVEVAYIEGTNADTFPKLVSSVQIDKNSPLLNLGFFNGQSFAQGNNSDLWEPIPDSVSNVDLVNSKYQISDRRGAYMVMDAMGLVYSKKAFKTPPTSWMDLFDSAYRGKVTTWDAPAFSVNALPVIAKLNGGSESDLDPGLEIFSKAAKAGQFHGFIASTDALRQQLNSGEVVIAPGFQGVAQPWIDAGDDIGFVAPDEGMMAFPEGFQLVKGSSDAQLEQAAKLMNELFTPENVAEYCNLNGLIPLVEGAELKAELADKDTFQLDAVESAIQIDWVTLVENIEDATTAWNKDVKAHI